ncbi:conserved hypothetical protein [Streptomyces griseoflavus Tu4000]|uniref:TerD domain-containing protein n=1 Tax=Streptomyces griseoflavus Tu4000 TaxID=467200 RepID=D9XTE3_9ACTN|nr:conserved hypothetical protein [Streptomyces griseoflavus Tu4000]
MNGLNKGIGKVEIALRWDPSPSGEPSTDLDLVAAPYPAGDPQAAPGYVVHFDSRSPDGTITLNRDSKDGKGFGFDEVMTLELDRLDQRYGRVVVGVVIQQQQGERTFSGVANPGLRICLGLHRPVRGRLRRCPRGHGGDGRGVRPGRFWPPGSFRPGVQGFEGRSGDPSPVRWGVFAQGLD